MRKRTILRLSVPCRRGISKAPFLASRIRHDARHAFSRTPQGLEAPLVRVEVDVGAGLPSFSVVGLLETAVKESKDRVRAALANCGHEFPAGRVTVNLAPADLPKEGGRFDLAIAVGILVASERLPAGPFAGVELYGELSLGGELHGTRGLLPSALQAARVGHDLIVPMANGREAALAQGARVFVAPHLRDVCRHAAGQQALALEAAVVCTRARRRPARSRPRRCAGAGGSAACPRDCGRRRTQPAADWSARQRQEHAGAAAARAAAGTRRGRSHRVGGDPFPVAARLSARGLAATTVSRAASHGVGRRTRRRRRAPATGRDFARAQRRAVPGRAAGVRSHRARGAARTAGERPHRAVAGGATSRVPRAVPAGGRDESVSLRALRRSAWALPLSARAHCRLPQPHLGPAARPDRSARGSGAGRAGGDRRDCAPRTLGRRRGQGRRGALAAATAAGAHQRPARRQ